MGRGDHDAFLKRGDVQYVAACDVRRGELNKCKDKTDAHYGNKDCQAYGDFRELRQGRKIPACAQRSLLVDVRDDPLVDHLDDGVDANLAQKIGDRDRSRWPIGILGHGLPLCCKQRLCCNNIVASDASGKGMAREGAPETPLNPL